MNGQTSKHLLVVGIVCYYGILAASGNVSSAAPARAGAPAGAALSTLPVKEVTIFKDGHAFMLHEGDVRTDAAGNVVLDYLPSPVIGTFWPYSADARAKLSSVVVGQRKVTREQPAINLRELLEANIGIEALIQESDGVPYRARILDVPKRTEDESRPAGPASGARPRPLDVSGSAILLEAMGGVKVVDVARIQEVTFLEQPKRTKAEEKERDVMTLHLDWDGGAPASSASVGLVYLQKGIRWIPNYRITIDGEGNARVELQATLLNEMTDIEDVTVHLVIGVPSFAFEETYDPIALQHLAAQLSPYFQSGGRTAYAFSNAIMAQQQRPRMTEHRDVVPPSGADALNNPASEFADAAQGEDLYVFTIEHVTLKKGERMVRPITTFTLRYKDVYRLEVAFAPPPEVRGSFNSSQQVELAKLYAAPKAIHALRLANSSPHPLTTAPALIVRDGRLLGQGMVTYTAPGGTSDLDVTTAVNIHVSKSDVERDRIPDAMKWQGHNYARVDLSGVVGLTNLYDHPVDLEVVRYVLGNVDGADHDGTTRMVNVREEGWYLFQTSQPDWYRNYNWPFWWHHFNGIGRIEWRRALDPGEHVELGYDWHYFWQ